MELPRGVTGFRDVGDPMLPQCEGSTVLHFVDSAALAEFFAASVKFQLITAMQALSPFHNITCQKQNSNRLSIGNLQPLAKSSSIAGIESPAQ